MATAAARERGASEAAVWVAGVAGAERPAQARKLGAEGADGAEPPFAALPGPAEPRAGTEAVDVPLTVAQVAAAVDTGRDLAAAAAADGVAVLVARGPAGHDHPARALLAALAADPSRPLRALRAHGTHELGVLCGIALGAGERGLGCACDGLPALAAAAVAAGIEPPLRPRLLALTDHDEAARLGIAFADPPELRAALH